MNMENIGKVTSYTSANALPIKIFTDEDLVQSILEEKKILPIHIQLVPTNRCNLRCTFCSFDERDRRTELSISELEEIVSIGKDLGTKGITITGGGEPLLHPQINELIEDIYTSGMKVGLVSNGKQLDKLRPENINLLTWYRISFDTNRKLDDTFIKNLDDVIKVNTQCDMAFSYVVASKTDGADLRTLVDYANDHNFSHLRIVEDLFNPGIMSIDNMKEILADKNTDKVVYQGKKEYTHGVPGCLISLVKPFIAADGYVYPCCVEENERTQIARDNKSSLSVSLKDVKKGDFVVNGYTIHRVLNTFKKKVDESLEIVLRGGKRMNVSKDHLVLVHHKGRLKMIEAKEVKIGDLLPVQREVITDSNDMISEVARLLGYYTAEGWTDKDGGITFAIGKEDRIKEDLFSILNSLGIVYMVYERPTVLQIALKLRTTPKYIRALLGECGDRASKKQVSNSVLNATKEAKLNYLWALVQGDGCFSKDKNIMTVRTISRLLANDLITLCNSIGLYNTMQEDYREGESYIEGRKVNIQNIYSIHIGTYKSLENFVPFGYTLKGGLRKRINGLKYKRYGVYDLVPVTSIRETKGGNFVDLQVEGSNAFLVNNILVHNCGITYAFGDEKREPIGMRMGHYKDLPKIIEQQNNYDGSHCVKCFYPEYNAVLQALTGDIKHREFI